MRTLALARDIRDCEGGIDYLGRTEKPWGLVFVFILSLLEYKHF